MKVSRYPALVFILLLLLSAFPLTASAKDQWIQVKSKNFFLIGNAPEKEVRGVGTRLEQFRESFRRLFAGANLSTGVPTNVVVFKSDSSYKPFKPRRPDGKSDDFIAGYFQPGEDVNYITLSVGGDDASTFDTIFHEYVHFVIDTNFGKTQVPQWFNEGLAEYYQTFEIAGDITVKLGLPQTGHLRLLQRNTLMPLDQLLTATNDQVHSTGGHSRGIFYAQSWALVHYLNQTGRSATLEKYVRAVIAGTPAQTAFETTFQTTYGKMENELRRYISQGSYKFNEVTFKEKLVFDTEMTAAPLDDAQSSAYLGDLLYHTHRLDEAERFLSSALQLDPNSSLANSALGMVRLRQNKYAEARKSLEKAIEADPKNYYAQYRYAFALSRENQDEFGFSYGLNKETAEKMRTALRKAIALNPTYTDSYELMAFVNLLTNENLDGSVADLQTALKYQPNNRRYAVRIAEIYARQNKLDEATALAEKVVATTEDPEIKSRAGNVLSTVRQMRSIQQFNAAQKTRMESAIGPNGQPRVTKRIEGVKKPSDAEIAREQELARLRTMNDALRPVAASEQRVMGRIQGIDCKKRPITFNVKTDAGAMVNLTSRDFESLSLTSLEPSATNIAIGCDSNISKFNALVTYSTKTAANQIVSIEFVPSDFRFMSEEEMNAATLVVYDDPDAVKPAIDRGPADDARRRQAVMQGIKDALRKPAGNEKRESGYLERIECTGKNTFFHFRVGNSMTLKLVSSSPSALNIVYFTPNLEGAQFGCNMKSIEYPAIITFTGKPDKKNDSAGEIVALEFVPKGFVLN